MGPDNVSIVKIINSCVHVKGKCDIYHTFLKYISMHVIWRSKY